MAHKTFLTHFSLLVVPLLVFYTCVDLTATLLFLGAYLLVFLLGFQSLSVNSYMKNLAMANSLGIGTCNLFMFKVVPDVDVSNYWYVGAYLIGGPISIIMSIDLHKWMKERKGK